MGDEATELAGPSAAQGRLIERTVIGVFGNKQHGKDTTARLLHEILGGKGKRATRMALADPLKEVAVHLLGMPREIAWGHHVDIALREQQRLDWNKYGKNAREWLQWLGTELGREQIDPSIWIDRTVDRIGTDAEGHQYFIITDCRFHNEREELRLKLSQRFINFMPIRVYRPGIPVDTNHPSEAEVASMTADMFVHVIDNDTDLPGLRARCNEFVSTTLNL